MASMQNNLHTSFCGMSLNSPIILLSGCVGFGEEYTRIKGFSNAEVGAVCLKGTTLEPRLGNKPHRFAETPNGMLNSIGLQNPGTEAVIDEIMPSLKKMKQSLSLIFLAQALKSTARLQNILMTLILTLLKLTFLVLTLKKVALLLETTLKCLLELSKFVAKTQQNQSSQNSLPIKPTLQKMQLDVLMLGATVWLSSTQ